MKTHYSTLKHWLDLSKTLKNVYIISTGPHKHQRKINKRNPEKCLHNFTGRGCHPKKKRSWKDNGPEIQWNLHRDADTQPMNILFHKPPLEVEEDPKNIFSFFSLSQNLSSNKTNNPFDTDAPNQQERRH